jgi:benzodiazapine receptor
MCSDKSADMRLIVVIRLVIACGVCLSVGFAGSFFTTHQSVSGWYAGLSKPFFTPPDWVFGPVWTILYLLMGVSAFLVWQKGLGSSTVRIALVCFGVQLFLNALWTPLFFGLKMPFVAFVEILLLEAAIGATILRFAKVSRVAAVLLVPYVVWVAYAAVLNGAIWLLNR